MKLYLIVLPSRLVLSWLHQFLDFALKSPVVFIRNGYQWLVEMAVVNTRLNDSYWIRTHNHSVRKRTSLDKCLSFRLRTKWLWVRIPLLSLKLQIWHLPRARSSLTFRQAIECGSPLKLTCTWHDNNIQTWLNAKHLKFTYHSISFSGHAVFM